MKRILIALAILASVQVANAQVKAVEGAKKALDNAVKLAKILMRKYNIPVERVIRHYDVTGKMCPGMKNWNGGTIYTANGKATKEKGDSSEWLKFKERLK